MLNFFPYTKLENWRTDQVLPGVGVDISGRVKEEGKRE
jgi:hypothetical protein